MFSRPFAGFAPGPDDLVAAAGVRTAFAGAARRAISVGALEGDVADISHVLLGVVHGMWSQEQAGWLGTSDASIERRWEVALDAVLQGSLRPGRSDQS